MKRIAVTLCALFLAAACQPSAPTQTPNAPAPETTPDPPIPIDPSAGPSGADTLTWFHDRTGGAGGRERLMYSEHSDVVGLNLQCMSDGVQVLLLRPASAARTPWLFTLASGTVRKAAEAANAHIIDEATQTYAVVLPRTEPVFAALESTGVLSVEDEDRTHVMDAINDDERAAIRSFFAACPAR